MWAQWLERTLNAHGVESYAERRAWRALAERRDGESDELDPGELVLVAREVEEA
jgi:hypothetical protein